MPSFLHYLNKTNRMIIKIEKKSFERENIRALLNYQTFPYNARPRIFLLFLSFSQFLLEKNVSPI